MSEQTIDVTKIGNGKENEMPKPRRGRKSIDLTPLTEKIADLQLHFVEDITDKAEKDKWSRLLRSAADRGNLSISVIDDRENNRVWFQGYPKGQAPARGRRKKVKTEV